ncbi:MAG: hypothetical protein MN733_35205 [Nitrososphaera sp.]|nr:hypothetical protein [Nitrososphaera sp.]
MCVVSMIMDHYKDTIPQWPQKPISTNYTFTIDLALEQWKADVIRRLDEMEKLIKAAKEYDTRNGEPDCELDSKREALKKIASEMGIEISFL